MASSLNREILQEATSEINAELSQQHRQFLDELLTELKYDDSGCSITHLSSLKPEEKKHLMAAIKRRFDQSQQGSSIVQSLKAKITTKIVEYAHVQPEQKQLFGSITTNLFLEHLQNDKDKALQYSTDILFGKVIPSELRRALWERKLSSDLNAKDFYKYDHQTKRVKFDEEMRREVIQTCQSMEVRLAEDQVDNVIRLLQYLYRKFQKVPTSPKYCLAVLLQSVLSNMTEYKINQLGACYISLLELTDLYSGGADQQHFNQLSKAMGLVDADSVGLLQSSFAKDPKQLIKTLRDFSNSLGASLLSARTSSYLVDQLLIKPVNKFDIYVAFSIVVLLLTSEGDLEKEAQPQEQQSDLLLLLQKARLIEPAALSKVYSHIYDGATLYYSPFESIPDSQLSRPTLPPKDNAMSKLLQLHQVRSVPIKQRPPPRQKKQQPIEQEPPVYYGLIPPAVNLDY